MSQEELRQNGAIVLGHSLEILQTLMLIMFVWARSNTNYYSNWAVIESARFQCIRVSIWHCVKPEEWSTYTQKVTWRPGTYVVTAVTRTYEVAAIHCKLVHCKLAWSQDCLHTEKTGRLRLNHHSPMAYIAQPLPETFRHNWLFGVQLCHKSCRK